MLFRYLRVKTRPLTGGMQIGVEVGSIVATLHLGTPVVQVNIPQEQRRGNWFICSAFSRLIYSQASIQAAHTGYQIRSRVSQFWPRPWKVLPPPSALPILHVDVSVCTNIYTCLTHLLLSYTVLASYKKLQVVITGSPLFGEVSFVEWCICLSDSFSSYFSEEGDPCFGCSQLSISTI